MKNREFYSCEQEVNRLRTDALDATTRALKHVAVYHDYSEAGRMPYRGELAMARKYMQEAVLCLANEAGQDKKDRIRMFLKKYELESLM